MRSSSSKKEAICGTCGGGYDRRIISERGECGSLNADRRRAHAYGARRRPPTARANARFTMSRQDPTPPERVPPARLIGWALLALVLVAGVVLYFLFGDSVAPIFTSKPS
ncbi:MAG: hypothetical protein NVS4B3_16570 [Gemmatimonadaceae bacterium]